MNNRFGMERNKKKHNTILTIWLVFMLVVNLLTTVSYLVFGSMFAALYPKVPFWIFYIYALGALANVAFTVFLFKWKKWAFFGLCGMAAIVFVLNIAVLSVGLTSISGLLGPVILYMLLRQEWNLLE